MKANTKVKITFGSYRGKTGKVLAKKKAPALTEGKLAIELDDESKTIIIVPSAIVEKN